MTKQQTRQTPADRATVLGLRLLNAASALPVMSDPKVRKRVEKFLYNGTRGGFRAETVARRTFKKVSGGGSPARAKDDEPRSVFDLTPTDDQQMIQEAARELAASVLRPAAQDADAARVVPDSVKEQAAELGLTLLGVPDALGGIAEERSAVTGVLVTEALAHGDVGLAAALLAPAAVATAIANYGDADQQATYPAGVHGGRAGAARRARHPGAPAAVRRARAEDDRHDLRRPAHAQRHEGPRGQRARGRALHRERPRRRRPRVS